MIKTAIIEDSKAVAGVYQSYLEDALFDVFAYTSTGPDIKRLIAENDFKLIVCPGFPKHQSGPEILRTIKSDPGLIQSKIVISTSMQTESVTSEWDLRDIDALLIKPFDKSTLNQVLSGTCPPVNREKREKPVALVIDDSKAVRNRLREYLQTLNFDVKTAADGMDGLQTTSTLRPDLILVDVEMPVLDGFEFCRQLSKEPDIKNIPTIVVSGTIDENQFRKGFRSGAIDFLEKPVSQPALAAIIESVSIREHHQSDGTTLILSQDPTLTAILTKSLNFLNSSINVCHTMDELETYICVAVPDIIILDLSQDEEKLRICRHVRNLLNDDSAVILAVAGESDRDVMFQCFKFGATEFIITPFGRDEVRARVENHIKLKKLQEELVKKNRILESLAYKDKLTGLMNRRFFDKALKDEIEKAKTKGSSLSFIMIDLDNFKSVNDNFGHDIGDMVLKEIGAMIMDNVLENAITCRYGGEEFCIIYPDTPLAEALDNSEKIRRYCSVKPISQHRIYQTLSGGLASYPQTSLTDELVSHADACLYRAKEDGKNRIIQKEKI